MIHVLVVGPPGAVNSLSGRQSVEVLRAQTAEEAVEKLARNRRIDAVLLLLAEGDALAARAIREEVVAPPPLFAPPSEQRLPDVRELSSPDPARLLELLAEALNAG